MNHVNNSWEQIGQNITPPTIGKRIKFNGGPAEFKLSEDGSFVVFTEIFVRNPNPNFTQPPDTSVVNVFENINNNWQKKGLEFNSDLFQLEIDESSIFLDNKMDSPRIGVLTKNNINEKVIKIFELVDNNWIQKGDDIEAQNSQSATLNGYFDFEE